MIDTIMTSKGNVSFISPIFSGGVVKVEPTKVEIPNVERWLLESDTTPSITSNFDDPYAGAAAGSAEQQVMRIPAAETQNQLQPHRTESNQIVEQPENGDMNGVPIPTKQTRLWMTRQICIDDKVERPTKGTEKSDGLLHLKALVRSIELSLPKLTKSTRPRSSSPNFELSADHRDVLKYITRHLKEILMIEDDEMIAADGADVWVPQAAGVYGRCLALIGRVGGDISKSNGWFSSVLSDLLAKVQSQEDEIPCTDCRKHWMVYRPAQLRLLGMLHCHVGIWAHSPEVGETHMVDLLWPLSQSLHHCRERIREISIKLLIRSLRSHRVSHGRIAKAVEVLCVQAYDTAQEGLQGLAERKVGGKNCGEGVHFLRTLTVIWQESPSSLRYKLHGVRPQKYFDVPSLWGIISPFMTPDAGSLAVVMMSKMIPALAAWDRPAIKAELPGIVAFFTHPTLWERSETMGHNIAALGNLTTAVSTDMIPWNHITFPCATVGLAGPKVRSEVACKALKMMLNGLGPTATRPFAHVMVIVKDYAVSPQLLELICGIPDLIFSLAPTVVHYLETKLKNHSEVSAIRTPIGYTSPIESREPTSETTKGRHDKEKDDVPLTPEETERAARIALLEAIPGFPLKRHHNLAELSHHFLLRHMAVDTQIDVLRTAMKVSVHPTLCHPKTSTEIVMHILGIMQHRTEIVLLEECLVALQNPTLEFHLKPVAAPLLLRINSPNLRVRQVVAQLLTMLASNYGSVILPSVRRHIRQSLIKVSSDDSQSKLEKLESASVICILLPCLPHSLSAEYAVPIVRLLLEALQACDAVTSEAEIALKALCRLAQFCPHVWDAERLSEAFETVIRLGRAPRTTRSRRPALSCLAALATLPIGIPLQNLCIQIAFTDCIFRDVIIDDGLKAGVMELVGAIGTTNRDPQHTRDDTAAIRREDGIYDDSTRRVLVTSTMRDKRGARSTEYQLALISDLLITSLGNRTGHSKLPVWEAAMRACLMLPHEQYSDLIFPMVLSDLIEEYEALEAHSGSSRNYRPKLIMFISQAMLLKPDYEAHWPAILEILKNTVQDGAIAAQADWSVLLVCLSIISRRKSDLKRTAMEVMPVIQSVIKGSKDIEAINLAFRLVASFQTHCEEYLEETVRASTVAVQSFSEEGAAVAAEGVRMLAYIAEYIPLYGVGLAIEGFLGSPSVTRLVDPVVLANIEKVRCSLAFRPMLPVRSVITDYPDLRRYQDSQFGTLAVAPTAPSVPFNPISMWSTEDVYDEEEWAQWLYQFLTMTLYSILEQCPAELLKICIPLHSNNHQGLLHAAFISWWESLSTDNKTFVEASLAKIIEDKNTPDAVLTALLSIIEFLHRGNASRFSERLLTTARGSLFRMHEHKLDEKADPLVLWYAELDCVDGEMTVANLSTLIESNLRAGNGSNIRQDDAAEATMELANERFGIPMNSSWLQALSRWNDALMAVGREEAEGDKGACFETLSSKIICLYAMTDFAGVYGMAKEHFDDLTSVERSEIASWVTVAAWAEGDFTRMARYASYQPKGSTRLLYKAVLDVQRNDFLQAQKHITKAQVAVYEELRARTGHTDVSTKTYSGAVKSLAKAEMLVELGEVIRYKQNAHSGDLQLALTNSWQIRLKHSHEDVINYYRRLLVWSLAAKPSEMQDAWLVLARMAREQSYKSARTILDFIGEDNQPGDKVAYARMKFNWEDAKTIEDRKPILKRLRQHTLTLSHSVGFPEGIMCHFTSLVFPNDELGSGGTKLLRRRLARSLQKLALWTQEMNGDHWLNTDEVLRYQQTSAMLEPDWYSIMNNLATMSLDLLDARHDPNSLDLPNHIIDNYVYSALYALFRSIYLQMSKEDVIKSTLLIISLWFRWGHNPRVLGLITQHMKSTDMKSWLSAIPQLIARLGAKDLPLRSSLMDLLKEIAKPFPDALIWPLLTAAQTPRSVHQNAAKDIMSFMKMSQDSEMMVQEAELIGRELMRCAISFAERWKSHIEKFVLVGRLSALHWSEVDDEYHNLEGAQTEEEVMFNHRYGDSLRSARQETLRFYGGNRSSYAKACAEYQAVYWKLCVQLDQWKRPGFKLDLFLVSPQLVAKQDMRIIVPGQYDPNKLESDQSYIRKFEPQMDVMATKMLPRKIAISSYKEKFNFLLKGLEDLRQDERIMQLISLINLLLNHNKESFYRQLFIQPYSVIPLSPDSGLLTWVSNTETFLHMISCSRMKIKNNKASDNEMAALIGVPTKGFRQVALDVDRVMSKYNSLPLHQKVAQLRDANSQTNQDDLKQTLWRRSSNSQTWLSRRTCFARSIATTSMFGFIIGLGDRHPANTLVEQTKFNAISIDFGDVFDASFEREAMPEKVPFRLTPQITNCFELAATHSLGPPGSRGHFKKSSVLTLGIMRDNKNTLLAMLEAFAYDPLLTWAAQEVDMVRQRKTTTTEGDTAEGDTADEDETNEGEASEETTVGGDQVDPPKTEVVPSAASSPPEPPADLVKDTSAIPETVTIHLGGSFIVPGSLVPHAHGPPVEVHAVAEKVAEEQPAKEQPPAEPEKGERHVSFSAATKQEAAKKEGGEEMAKKDGGEESGKKEGGEVPTKEETEQPSKRSNSGGQRDDSYLGKFANVMTNERALAVLNRVERRLTGRDGRDLDSTIVRNVEDQVQFVIVEATAQENLAQGYILGWLPHW